MIAHLSAPAAFQRLMDYLFSDMREFTGVYIDDIVLFCDSLEDHL